MASEINGYGKVVEVIKTAILQAQYVAAKDANAQQLQLYYAVGGYLACLSEQQQWGSGALDAIGERLQRDLPGLRGFSGRNLRFMRTFYSEWCDRLDGLPNLELASAELTIDDAAETWNLQVPESGAFPLNEFLSIGFTHHRWILSLAKTLDERLFYIHKCASEHLSVDALKHSIKADDFYHQGKAPNNYLATLPKSQQALRAINTFKDEYLLDFINVEELGVRDAEDVDERVLEQGIVQNIKQFIMTFGRGFSFVGNQFHLDAFGVDQYIDLLFFNRDLNCLVAVELKRGPFKTAYLGQLSGYLRVLDDFERREHENPSIGLVLCKDMSKAFVDYVIQDYNKPMGVATYKTSEEMSSELLDALPPIDDLKTLLEGNETL
ncbi:PF06250 family protein [Coriobacteriaceae bacterium BV3Ac1]|nr:PDDEXK nuclease domain-containing protein [Olegusella massiliensis]ERL11997.1 PF06250 family protein [Coriobacteriaceae bacterium BV3Ac1]